MNYNSVILVGTIALTGFWWAVHAIKHYPGPKVMTLYIHDDQPIMARPAEAVSLESEHKNQ